MRRARRDELRGDVEAARERRREIAEDEEAEASRRRQVRARLPARWRARPSPSLLDHLSP
mgnify:CR=1 FL=1